MEIHVNDEIKQELQQIAKLKNISVEQAVELVLERYTLRAKNQIERASLTAERAIANENF